MLQQQLTFAILCAFAIQVSADIVLDGTLGTDGILSGPRFEIEAKLGQLQGHNLFHSFSQFNLYSGEKAIFSGPNEVTNIISRVTGGNSSQINGELRLTIPHANFYFLNPAGVMFGEGAELNMSGHFYVSTADSLYFDDGKQFSATQPNNILTVASPTDFGFLDSNVAPIKVTNTELSVKNQRNLSIIGGDIQIQESGLHAPEGIINLTSVASQGKVSIEPSSLNNFAKLGQIELANSTLGNGKHKSDGAKNIYIRGGKFYNSGSLVNAKILKNDETSSIEIDSREKVILEQNAIITTNSFSAIDAGNIIIKTDILLIENAKIKSNTQQGGAAGMIKIKANHITINDGVKLTSNTDNKGGSSGYISITADSTLKISGKTRIDTTTNDNTSTLAGSITIKADKIQMLDDATIDTTASHNASSGGGEVTIEANQLEMKDRAWIISSSFGQGKSGTIKINTNTLNLSGESAIASTTFSQGEGGDIVINIGNTLSISDIAVVTSGTEGQGEGGNIFITIPSTYTFDNIDNISAASEVKDVVTQEIFRIFKNAKQLGGKIDGSIFAGGGKSGQVYITDKEQFFDNSVANLLADASRLLVNCVDKVRDDSHFVVDVDDISDADIKSMLKNPQPPSFKDGLTKSEILAIYQSLQEQLATTSTRQSETLAQLAALYEHEYRYPEALQLNEQALKALNLLNAPYWRYKLQWQRGRLFKALGEYKNAIIAYQAAIRKLVTIRQHLTKIYRDRYPNGERSEFREVLKPIFTELVALQIGLAERLQNDTSEKLFKTALQTMNQLKTAELQDYFQDDCTKPTIDLEQVDPLHTAIIYPIFLPNRVELLVSLPRAKRLHKTVPATPQQLTQTISNLSTQLNCETCQESYLASAQKLYDWLLRPLEPALSNDIHTLVFVPDGPLYSIPMAVLHDGHQFLIEKYAIAITPSLTITQPTTRHFSPKILYSALTASKHPDFAPIQQYVTPMQNEFEKTFGSITTLKGKNFALPNLSQALHIPHTIAHVFSHAQFSPQVNDTFIVTYNEKLSMNKLEQLIAPKQHSEVPLELLTLSACETAKGDERAALGLVGVAYKAGARSAVATLWSVRDDVVYHLFKKFYQALVEKQQPKAQAMRQAQLMLLKEFPSWQHPHYWAAFLLIGHWL